MKSILRTVASLTSAAMLGAASLARAATAAPFAAPGHEALPSPAGGLLRVTLALMLVLAAVFTAAWVSRRVRGTGGARSSNLEVLAQLPLGPRERAVLIRVGERQLLVGVANGCIRTLHVLEQPQAQVSDGSARPPAGDVPQRPSFKALLLKSLGK